MATSLSCSSRTYNLMEMEMAQKTTTQLKVDALIFRVWEERIMPNLLLTPAIKFLYHQNHPFVIQDTLPLQTNLARSCGSSFLASLHSGTPLFLLMSNGWPIMPYEYQNPIIMNHMKNLFKKSICKCKSMLNFSFPCSVCSAHISNTPSLPEFIDLSFSVAG